MTETKNLSSIEKLLLSIDQPEVIEVVRPLCKGELCPQCRKAQLDYNGLLQLECPVCGFVSGEGGGCT
jgi:hypothetical protein